VTRLGQDEWALSYNAAGDLLVLQGRRVVVHRRDGATRRLALPNLSGSFCGGGFYGSWIDRRRILVEGGLHGQRTGDIWRVDPATGRETMFAGGPDWEAAPALSPNGASVAFEVGGAITHGGGCSGPYTPLIAVVRPDGSGRRAVTSTGRTHDFAPRWSPAGDALAVRRESLGEENDFGVVVVNPKTRAERWLVRGRAATPSWSSEGNSVVFEGAQGVVRAPRGGGAVVAIAAGGKTPAASPTAAVVAFVRDGALWTVGLDGSGQRRLASVATAPEEPRWSPDGRRLAIAGTDAIVVVGADGTGLRTIDRAGAFQLAWSPDSQRLAFAAPVGRYTRELFNNDLANRSDVFVVSADGGVPRRVTHDFANVDGIAWGRLAPQ
jgi:Tol biopolymer transport system component